MTPHALIAPARLAGQPVLMTQTDERLVDLVRAGSEPAFEAIVSRYRRPLLRHCSRILPEERAEDAVQQTFVRAYGAMRKNGDELNLRPWLYRIAHNTALNALRDRGLRHEELSEQIDGVERPDQALERSESLSAVVSAVQDLPERQRDAIVLRELEGRSYDQIAHELGVTGGAVRQLLNRARNTLRATATALTPAGFLTGLPWEGGTAAAGAGGTAIAAKVCATALATSAVVVGGVAVAPELRKHEPSTRPATAVPSAPGEVSTPLAEPAVIPGPAAAGLPATRGAGGPGSGDGHGGFSKRGSRSSGPGSSDSNSGSGSGSKGSGSSGPGPGGSGSSGGSSGNGSGSSGSGSSGSGSSGIGSGHDGSGSGSQSSRSGPSGSGSSASGSGSSGSGSGSSGSGSSGSGSGSSGRGSDTSLSRGSASSGSGTSGSGSSGSGSSGSGSGDSGSSGSGSSGSG